VDKFYQAIGGSLINNQLIYQFRLHRLVLPVLQAHRVVRVPLAEEVAA
jgi:hypothetical protein